MPGRYGAKRGTEGLSAIYLTSVGEADPEILAGIQDCLARHFPFEIRRFRSLPDPGYAYDAKAGQYSSTLIVKELVRVCPAEAVRVFAVTEKDLFIPMLTFVFGQAQLGGSAAIISLARLRQEFYQLPPNRPLLAARSIKETLHEMGHTFGLIHCPDRECTMSLAINIQQLDRKGTSFCRSCEAGIRECISMIGRQSVGPRGREVQG
jgi:archaemetzincin